MSYSAEETSLLHSPSEAVGVLVHYYGSSGLFRVAMFCVRAAGV